MQVWQILAYVVIHVGVDDKFPVDSPPFSFGGVGQEKKVHLG